MVGQPSSISDTAFELAHQRLMSSGFTVTTARLEGEIVSALQNYRTTHAIDLMVMGAYGHSRIRQFLVGSHTTQLLHLSDCALLLLR
ncbi:MAG: hypothetical protein GKR77_07735 [Legionellales bacterium]|nr:hypothetical protein [Legionellales bacterium]